jgi:CheY-like chemotaxis protein
VNAFAEDGWAVFEIADRAGGVPAELLPRIFEPFFTTKPAGKGTGMGLAMVYGTVRDHGGSIHVDSEEGRGTTFRIYLPVIEAAPERADEEVHDPIRGEGRVLVVDDEEVVRKSVHDMLVSLGYGVALAVDGDEAVDYYAKHVADIDLAIIDMVMPGMSGVDCLRALRQINPEVRAVLSTGYGLNEEAEEVLADGTVILAQKPYGLLRLSQAVHAALADGRSQRPT